jgi:hypothetical protein
MIPDDAVEARPEPPLLGGASTPPWRDRTTRAVGNVTTTTTTTTTR